MALQLRIYPLSGPREVGEESVLLDDHLSFETNSYSIFAQLLDMREFEGATSRPSPIIRPLPLPPQMVTQYFDEEEGLKEGRRDSYGKELTFVYARDLKCLVVPSDSPSRNLAVKAFIDALPDDTPIILWWE